jgi:hypothetical protein
LVWPTTAFTIILIVAEGKKEKQDIRGIVLLTKNRVRRYFATLNDYFAWRYFQDAPFIAFPQIALFLPQMMLGE